MTVSIGLGRVTQNGPMDNCGLCVGHGGRGLLRAVTTDLPRLVCVTVRLVPAQQRRYYPLCGLVLPRFNVQLYTANRRLPCWVLVSSLPTRLHHGFLSVCWCACHALVGGVA